MGKQLVLYVGPSKGRDGVKKHRKSKSHAKRHGKSKTTEKKFIKKNPKHKGSFKKYCKKNGHKGANKACIKETLIHGTKKRKKQAVFARTLRKLARHVKK